jgi:predicted nucleic-acid-binding Zn-ribbon protein
MSNPSRSLRRFTKGIKAAARSFAEVSDEYVVGGKKVACPHCGGERFEKQAILMNTAGMSFLNLDWLNKKAYALSCKACGRIEWFRENPKDAD